MIASCHRKTGNYQRALETYKRIHTLFPENVECESRGGGRGGEGLRKRER